jgi:hypothetical protein
MIVLRVKTTFPLRVAEWISASMLASWGAILTLAPEVFDNPLFSVMHSWAPQGVWALACLWVGLTRLAVLAINGAWRASPQARALLATVSLLFWATISLGLGLAGPATGLAVYPWLVVLEFWNVHRAAGDAREAALLGGRGAH